MADTVQSHEELVYAAAIVILADDLYPRKLEIVREYIQNASDALDAFSRVADYLEDGSTPQMKVSVQGRSLLIFDNGIGMDEEAIQKLKRIAYSEKREGQEAGYKGIGRLAGIAVANKLLISSTSYGDPKLHKFEFRARALHDGLSENRRKGIQEPATTVINRHTTVSALDVDPADHYTIVELREIDERYPELLDPVQLREFIGDIGPVGFAPDFTYGQRISDHLSKHVPDYSPKVIWLATASGDRAQVYRPYTDSMALAEPEFIEIYGPGDAQRLLGYCWCATKGKDMLGKVRSSGGKFTVEGSTSVSKKRLAGLVYKLFGFSVGDRSLPLRTLWSKDYTRPLWFTGEIHIVDKGVKPTTDRSDFIDNEARRQLYNAAQARVAKHLSSLAQDISDNRNAHDLAARYQERFRDLSNKLKTGGIERAELGERKRELHEALEALKRTCTDKDIQAFIKEVSHEGRDLLGHLEATRSQKEKANEINDLAREVGMTSHARRVYTIVMETLAAHFRDDKDTYYDLSAEINKAVKKRY
jgi:molecular chaperone HtpG